VSTLAVTDPVLLDFAGEVGRDDAVAVEGGRTRWDAGGPPAGEVRLLRAPAGIFDHRPEEMIVRVGTGTTVADLHAQLAERGQRTALPERGGTVGGALAVGEHHLEVLGRGPVRNAALQIRYVAADGRLVTGGGPTVKNVTGFNLPKLLVGSLGTLGLLCEVVLRTNPVPPVRLWLRSPDVDPFAVPDVVLRPGAVLWDGTTTWVLLEGHGPDVAAEADRLTAIGRFEDADGSPPLPPHRWSLSPASLRHASVARHGPFVASIGVGTVFAADPQIRPPLAPEALAVAARMKRLFDPTGRLNPGRDPAVR
jgi:glycolate oxidase FAD binding subunit